MSKVTWILVVSIAGYVAVLLFTRTPDFFSSRITKGKVIGVTTVDHRLLPSRRQGRRKATIYSPYVAYEAGGKTYSFSDDNARWPPIYGEGDQVKIIYDPKNPQNSYMFSLIGYWLNISEIFIALFVIGLPIAVYSALKKKKDTFAHE